MLHPCALKRDTFCNLCNSIGIIIIFEYFDFYRMPSIISKMIHFNILLNAHHW